MRRCSRTALLLVLVLTAGSAWPAETCHYSGTTSQSGHVTLDTTASTVNGETTVDVAARIDARSLLVLNVRFLHQEISVWRGDELRSVAVNHRYMVNGAIKRQQWDVFTRGKEGLAAQRAQAKTPADFQAKHPGFVRHWPPETFAQPWREDYAAAAPERRADLDLPAVAMPAGLGTPLAMAFYWIRWADADGRAAPLFLPGFKKDARIDVPLRVAGAEADGTRHLRALVRHPQLSAGDPSTGDAWVSADHRLLRATFEAHGAYGNVQGALRLDRCEGRVAGS